MVKQGSRPCAVELACPVRQQLPAMLMEIPFEPAWTSTQRADCVSDGMEIGPFTGYESDILDSLPAGLVLLDGRGIVVYGNPAAEELLGRPLRGRLWRELIASVFMPRLDDGHDVSLRDGRRVSIATRPFISRRGQLLQLTDVTETRRLQDRLASLGRLSELGRMAAGLAHQIRTPISAALLYAAHLTESTLDDERRQRFAGKLVARLTDLESLVRELLVFARGGGLQQDIVSVDSLLEDLQASLHHQLDSAGAVLHLDRQRSESTVPGNREALLSALQNPVLNAIQAGARHVRVGVTHPDARTVEIRIADDGPGIPEEKLESVFDAFFTTRSEGTGLGLAMVKAVVQGHGGATWAARAPDGGALIVVQIPAFQRCSERFPQHRASRPHFAQEAQA